jgi:hypothetical protein
MAREITAAPLKALEGATLALSTTADYIAVKPGWHEVKMYCATQWRLALSPALVHCLYYLASAGTYTEYKTQATDGLSTTHVPLDAMATGDYLYMGFSEPALGVYIDVGTNAQANAATLDVEYCSTAVAQGATLAFTDVAGDSDGTTSGGAALAIDGVYTWTLPSAWVRSTLGTYATPTYTKCYWIRFAPSATLSAAVDLNEIIPVYQNVNYGYMEPGLEYQFTFEPSRCGGFVVKATAGTPTLDYSWIKH